MGNFDELLNRKQITQDSIDVYNKLRNYKLLNKNINRKKVYNNNSRLKISVIIPTYNRRKQLDVCISSILSQSYHNIEIIIIDDCSNDDTKEKYQMYLDKRVKYYRNIKNLGVGLNRNKGLLLSTGDLVIFCDDDDYYIDLSFFENAIEIFENNSNINIICASSIINFEKENDVKESIINFDGNIDSMLYLKNFQSRFAKPNSTFCAIFRKTNLLRAKFEDMKMMNDTSIYLRALMMGGITYGYKNVVGVYRVHSHNLTGKPIDYKFILENFEEKHKIYLYLKENNKMNFLKRWFSRQIYITASYFYNGYEKNEDSRLIIKWMSKKVDFICMVKIIIKIIRNKLTRLKNEN